MESLTVPLGRSGLVALVDADQYERPHTFTRRDGVSITLVPSSVNWLAFRNRHNKYASSTRSVCGEKFLLTLHRLITDCPAERVVDHANGDTLDNRLSNLRICTIADNARNEHRKRGGFSQFRGVAYDCGKWAAQIQRKVNGRHTKVYLGLYPDQETAARAYDTAARIWWGEFARPNLPDAEPIELPARILAKLF